MIDVNNLVLNNRVKFFRQLAGQNRGQEIPVAGRNTRLRGDGSGPAGLAPMLVTIARTSASSSGGTHCSALTASTASSSGLTYQPTPQEPSSDLSERRISNPFGNTSCSCTFLHGGDRLFPINYHFNKPGWGVPQFSHPGRKGRPHSYIFPDAWIDGGAATRPPSPRTSTPGRKPARVLTRRPGCRK